MYCTYVLYYSSIYILYIYICIVFNVKNCLTPGQEGIPLGIPMLPYGKGGARILPSCLWRGGLCVATRESGRLTRCMAERDFAAWYRQIRGRLLLLLPFLYQARGVNRGRKGGAWKGQQTTAMLVHRYTTYYLQESPHAGASFCSTHLEKK